MHIPASRCGAFLRRTGWALCDWTSTLY